MRDLVEQITKKPLHFELHAVSKNFFQYIDMIYGNVTLAPIDRTTATTPFPLPCGSQ